MKLMVSILAAALCCAGGWVFTLRLFKEKKIDFSARKKAALTAVSAVLFASIAAAFSLLIMPRDMDFPSVLRSEILIFFLFFIAVIDYKLMIIPNKLLLILLAATVLSYVGEAIYDPGGFMPVCVNALLGCAVCFVIFLIGKLISRKGMGMGDIKLAALMGLTLGIENAMGSMLWSMLIAAVTGAVLMISKKMKSKSKIAMAPFFFMGTLVGHIIFIVSGVVGGSV